MERVAGNLRPGAHASSRPSLRYLLPFRLRKVAGIQDLSVVARLFDHRRSARILARSVRDPRRRMSLFFSTTTRRGGQWTSHPHGIISNHRSAATLSHPTHSEDRGVLIRVFENVDDLMQIDILQSHRRRMLKHN